MQSIEDFEQDRDKNLYRIWNRMSSGSYFPPPVRAVEIPKSGAGCEFSEFRPSRIGWRRRWRPCFWKGRSNRSSIRIPMVTGPKRSALDAVAKCRERCWKNDWVVDLDIQKFFDSVPWRLMLKAVAHHIDAGRRWILLYVERWLQAPLRQADGTTTARDRGTPQGSAISPVLANLFMHYAFDAWMTKEFPASASNDTWMTRWCTASPNARPRCWSRRSDAGCGRSG